MNFEIADNLVSVKFDMITTLAIAGVVLLIGITLCNKIKFLRKYCIPSAVVGGFLFMILVFIGHQANIFAITFDTTFQTIFMVAFFTTIGLGADFKVLKIGGRILLIYWICVATISALQSPIALGIGSLLGLDPGHSITAGAMSMCGGHGAATAYGFTLQERGYVAAQDCGLAAATFGLIVSVLVGGPLSRRLIIKNNLKPADINNSSKFETVKEIKKELSMSDIMKNFVVILLCMAIGIQIGNGISYLIGSLSGTDISLPDYVGAMIISIFVRNMNEKFHWYNYSQKVSDVVGSVTLDLFLSIAMMSIKLWQLLGLVGGLAVIVCVQASLLFLISYFVMFRVLGKNYDAAIMCAGACGHMLGATPTAMANMNAVCERFGYSKTAFLVVPIAGSFLVDIVYQPITITLLNVFCPVIS